MIVKYYKYHYAYIITNNINEKMYMGIHSSNDLNDNYMGSGTILNHAFRKYGKENFKKSIVKVFDTRKEASDYEKYQVNEEVINDDRFYNIKVGGDGFEKLSKESIQKSAKAKIGRNKYNHTGVAETSRKMSIIMKGRNKDNNEGMKRMSELKTGRKKETSLTVKKMSISKSPFLYITPFGVFYNGQDAEKILGIHYSTFVWMCKDKDLVFSKRRFNTAKKESNVLSKMENNIGKTFKEIGFTFIDFTKDIKEKLIKLVEDGFDTSPLSLLYFLQNNINLGETECPQQITQV